MSMDLYVSGKMLPKDKRAVAVVGSRKMSSRGKKLTDRFVYELVKNKYTIISGLARGVDTAAHEAALRYGGRTIAVLGSGLDIIYPPENSDLAFQIVKSGAVVSPFSYGTKPLPQNFLARNRIIALLSQAVLVIEGARRSGTLSTTSWAAKEGVEVLAIPGSEVCDWLISEGATSCKEPGEVIEYLNALNYC